MEEAASQCIIGEAYTTHPSRHLRMFPVAGIPKETKRFPDLTKELPQIDAFPFALGEHSDLFRARRINDKRRGNVFALKTLRAGSSSNPSFETLHKKLVKRGVQLAQLNYENIAEIRGIAYGPGRLPGIVMDYYAGSIISWETANEEKLQWVKQITSGLKYSHRRETPVVHGDLRGSAATSRSTAPELRSSRRDRSHVEGSATPPTLEGDASAEGVNLPPPRSPSADAAGGSAGSDDQWTKAESRDTTGEGAKTRGENRKVEIVGYAEQVRVERIGTTQAGRDVTIHKTYNYYLPPETDHILAGRTSQLETSFSSLLKDFSSMSQDLASSANVSSDLRQRIESIDSRLRRLEQLIADSVGSPHINVGPSGISISPPPGWVAPISPQPMVTLPPVASTPTPSAACPTFTWVPVPIALFYAPPMAGSVAPMPTGMPVVPPPHSGDLDTPPVPQTSIPPNSPLATSTSTVSP